MKKNKFKILCLVLTIFIVTGCGCNNKKEIKEKTKNPNAPIIKYEQVGNLKFGTASFYISDENTYINVSIINDTKSDVKVEKFKILLKDSEGKVIKSIDEKLEIIKAGETKEISDSVEGKLFDIATIDYEIK